MASSPLIRTARLAARPVARAVRRHILPRVMPTMRHPFPEAVRNVRVVGLLSSSSGLGESARLCIDSLTRAGCGVTTADVAALFDSDDGVAYPRRDSGPRADVAIYHLNPTMLLPSILRAGLPQHLRTYSIGYWAWELETLPPEWVGALRFVDAVMVPSRFCQEAVQAYTSKPVVVVPHPVERPTPVADTVADPAARGADARFRVVSIFNLGSSFLRKNPVAAIMAFRAAFGESDAAELVLKISDGARYPAERDRIHAAIAGARNIRLIDAVWDRAALQELLASADAYLSLHRSEGFGLTLAEAALAGIPVVATNWSGSTDICPPELCYPVDHALVPFNDPHPAYAGLRRARWAEPDVAHAAEQLRRIRAAPAEARARARALRTWLAEYLARHDYRGALGEIAARMPAGVPEALGRDAARP